MITGSVLATDSPTKTTTENSFKSQKKMLLQHFSNAQNILSTSKSTKFLSNDKESSTILSSYSSISTLRRDLMATPDKNMVNMEEITSTFNDKENVFIPTNTQSNKILDGIKVVDKCFKSNIGTDVQQRKNMNMNIISSNMKAPKSENDIATLPNGNLRNGHNIKHCVPKRKISGRKFKACVYNLYIHDFCKLYTNLGSEVIPDCCDAVACDKRHKDINPNKISKFRNATFFAVLDHPLFCWTMYDVAYAAYSVLTSDQYFTDDVLRMFFTYLLNGPCNIQMMEVQWILTFHFELHPPCTKSMRQFYLQLLNQPCSYECEFKTDLAAEGVFNYVMRKLDAMVIQEPQANESQMAASSADTEDQPITFQLLEERYHRGEPLLDKEKEKMMKIIDYERENDFQETILPNDEAFKRLTLALKLIVDLLKTDFLICVSKLKRYIADESKSLEVQVPLIKEFMDCDMSINVFKLYATTTDKALWKQLTRLIGVMAEQVHLFKLPVQRLWQYPNLHSDCNAFVTALCDTIDREKWDSSVQLQRLQELRPTWLQFQVAMQWAGSDLKLSVKNPDLNTLVEIIHMHIKSPIKLEKIFKKAKYDKILVAEKSPLDIKKVTRKNKYGEVRLHYLCKKRGSSMAELQSVLALPETDINAKDNNGTTPLHEAVWSQSILKARLLLHHEPLPGKAAVDICAQTNDGYTPLHYAVFNNSLEICKLLVDFGGMSLLRKTDHSGKTSFDYAKDKAEEVPEILQYFQEVIRKQELLNLNTDSELNIGDHVIQLLMIASDAFMSDYHTSQLYCTLKTDDNCIIFPTKKFIWLNKATLFKFREDQYQREKLCKILNKLSRNPKNSTHLKRWCSNFQSVKSNTLDLDNVIMFENSMCNVSSETIPKNNNKDPHLFNAADLQTNTPMKFGGKRKSFDHQTYTPMKLRHTGKPRNKGVEER